MKVLNLPYAFLFVTILTTQSWAQGINDSSTQALTERLIKLEERVVALEKKLEQGVIEATVLPACADFFNSEERNTAEKRCKTKGGFIYERVQHPTMGLSWRAPNGLMWSSLVGSEKYPDAVAACKKMNAKLPTLKAWKDAESMDIRQVVALLALKDKEKTATETRYWSATAPKHDNGRATKGAHYAYIIEVVSFGQDDHHSAVFDEVRAFSDEGSLYFHCVTRE